MDYSTGQSSAAKSRRDDYVQPNPVQPGWLRGCGNPAQEPQASSYNY